MAAGHDRDGLAPQAARPEEKHELLNRLIQVFASSASSSRPSSEDVLDPGSRHSGADARRGLRDGPYRRRARRGVSAWHTADGSALLHTTSAAWGRGDPPSSRVRRRSKRSSRSRRSPRRDPPGDVKYHYGHGGVYKTVRRSACGLYPQPEPSRVRGPGGHGRRARRETSRQDTSSTIHGPVCASPRGCCVPRPGRRRGDAQPAVAEGVRHRRHVHIIQNNQIGFTTDPEEGRLNPTPPTWPRASTSDRPRERRRPRGLRRGGSPGDGLPRWGRDVVIDLIGYRRFGHNETDEPAYTQPLMAAKIKEHPPVSQVYARRWSRRGSPLPTRSRSEPTSASRSSRRTQRRPARRSSRGSTRSELDRTRSPSVETAVPEGKLRKRTRSSANCRQLHHPPHASRSKRLDAMNDGGIEFGHAEEAGARLAADGGRRRTSASPARTPSVAPSPIATSSSTTRRRA